MPITKLLLFPTKSLLSSSVGSVNPAWSIHKYGMYTPNLGLVITDHFSQSGKEAIAALEETTKGAWKERKGETCKVLLCSLKLTPQC
jgi:hypothetical protein